MKNWKHGLIMAVIAIITLTFAFTACSGGGGKSLNSAAELREYLDKQPANSPDKPIKVAMKVNDMMINDIVKVISEAGKYVSLDLSGSPLTEIPRRAFVNCKTLAGITIPNGVTSIGSEAFGGTSLTNVTIPNSVTTIGIHAFWCENLTTVTIGANVRLNTTQEGSWAPKGHPFGMGFQSVYEDGGSQAGTYTTTTPRNGDAVWNSIWTKKSGGSGGNATNKSSESVSLEGIWLSDNGLELNFNSPSNVIFGGAGYDYYGNYTISGNKVTITFLDPNEPPLTGTISRNVLTIDVYGVFTKQ